MDTFYTFLLGIGIYTGLFIIIFGFINLKAVMYIKMWVIILVESFWYIIGIIPWIIWKDSNESYVLCIVIDIIVVLFAAVVILCVEQCLEKLFINQSKHILETKPINQDYIKSEPIPMKTNHHDINILMNYSV